MRRNLALLCCLVLGSVSGQATSWDENTDGGGDAGETLATAQVPVGSGPLTTITGNDPGQNADLYKILVSNTGSFSVTLSASFTDQLWLFDSVGQGVAHIDGGALSNSFLSGAGIYYVGLSRNDYDATNGAGLIWNNTPAGVERAPDGPGAGSPLTGWTGLSPVPFENYTLTLSGVSYVPEPGSFALLALGLAGLSLPGRRR